MRNILPSIQECAIISVKESIMRSLRATGLSLCLALSLAACHTTQSFNSREQVASVRFSVNAVMPWDEVKDRLSPNFSLNTGDDALKALSNPSAIATSQSLDGSAFGLSASLVGTAKTYQSILEKEDGQTVSDTSTLTTTRNPATVPEPAENAALPDNLSPPNGIQGNNQPSVPPRFQYANANNLLQYVQLKNLQLEYAAIRKGYVPYVVLMNYTPTLYQRNAPVDLHATVSFFPPNADNTNGVTHTPFVIPILATDNLEFALQNRSDQVLKQLGTSIGAAIKGIGANVTAENIRNDIDAILTNDLNSILTVGRLTDNSLSIRIGATKQSDQYNLIGATYDIAALVMIPETYFKSASTSGSGTVGGAWSIFTQPNLKSFNDGTPKAPGSAKISVVSITEFRDSQKGTRLANRDIESQQSTVRKILTDTHRCLDPNVDWSTLRNKARELIEISEENRWTDFIKKVKEICATRENKKINEVFLWNDLITLLADNDLHSTSIEVFGPTLVSLPYQTALYLDQGDKGANVTLQNVSNYQAGQLQASLIATTKGNSYTLPATNITYSETSKALTFGFPSLSAMKIVADDIKMELQPQGCPYDPKVCGSTLAEVNPVLTVISQSIPLKETPAGFTLRQQLDRISINENKEGRALVVIEDLEPNHTYKISVTGASLLKALGPNGETINLQNLATVPQAANQVIELFFDNLQKGKAVTVTATGSRTESVTDQKPNETKTNTQSVEFDVVS